MNHYENINIYNITEKSKSNYSDKSKSDNPEEDNTVQKSKNKIFPSSLEKRSRSNGNKYFDISKDYEITVIDKTNDTNVNLTNTNKSKKTKKEKLSFSQNKRLITSHTFISNSYENTNLENIYTKQTKEELIGEIIVEKVIKNTCKESCTNNCIIF